MRTTGRPPTPIVLPKGVTADLAYETGLHLADGNLYTRVRGTKTDYVYSLYGNARLEYAYYKEVVSPLLHRLYAVKPAVQRKTKNTLAVILNSKHLFEFKLNLLELHQRNSPRHLPTWAQTASPTIRTELLSGLLDGEASLVFVRRTDTRRPYPRFKLEMKQRRIVAGAADLLGKLGIRTTKVYQRIIRDRRTGRTQLSWYFNVNGYENCRRVASILKLRNPKLVAKCQLLLDAEGGYR